MHFDINELKSRLILLEELLNSTDDKYKKIEIFNDINKIKYLIRYIDKNALLNLYDTNEGIIGDYKEKDDDVVAGRIVDFFNKYTMQIRTSIGVFSNMPKLPWRIWKNTIISNKKYFELISNFMKEFNPEMLEIYNNLVQNKRIELSIDKYEGERYVRGLCFCVGNLKETYILSRFNNKMNTGIILPHELGHAYLFYKSDFNNESNIFIEAYSIFIEFIFGDYLKNTVYAGSAFNNEYQRLDTFLGMVDYEFDNLIKLKGMNFDFPFYYTKDGSIGNVDTATLILSNMLGMYLTHLYRFDRDRYNNEIKVFLEMYGRTTDEEILKYFGLSNLVDGSIDTLDTYVKTYRR